MSPSAKKKASSVRHTRAIQRDRSKRPLSAPSDEQITARLTEVVHPATLQLVNYYHQLGLRARLLTLPGIVAFVLSLIWRQFNGVSELVRCVIIADQQGPLVWFTGSTGDAAFVARRSAVRLIK